MSQTDVPTGGTLESLQHRCFALVLDLAERYRITALAPLIDSCRSALGRTDLSVGVLGRFKAGKSSFLNHLAGRQLLPVGVIPVTAVVTDLSGGEVESAAVRFQNAVQTPVKLGEVRQYVSEAENPDNRKGVASVSIRVPELRRFGGIRLFDTPGLESAFTHNTEASQQWAPNVDVALVAIAVDPPLSQQDISLIRKLLDYTPRVAVLLTKFDLLDSSEQAQVLDFVKTQLARNVTEPIDVFPYSTRPGYEHLVHAFEEDFIHRLRVQIGDQRRSVVTRKIRTLARECGEYMRLTLKSAAMLDSEKAQLRERALGEKNSLADTTLELRLIAKHATAQCRSVIEKALAPSERPVREEVLAELDRAAETFPNRLDLMVELFQDWLDGALSSRLIAISEKNRAAFVQPLSDVQRQYVRVLQNFRDRLSERILEIYGVPLRTTEPEIATEPPKAPDVNIGRVFDHSWELLSPVLPMRLFRRAVLRRFRRKIVDETFKNFSRLTSQWEEIVNRAILQLQREAEHRIEDLVRTVDRLTSAASAEAPAIKEDLDRLEQIAVRIQSA